MNMAFSCSLHLPTFSSEEEPALFQEAAASSASMGSSFSKDS